MNVHLPTATDKAPKSTDMVTIAPPKMAIMTLHIVGTSPLMICRFSEKSMNAIKEKQEAGSQANAKKQRSARDFEADFQSARHLSKDGWDGINASAFRNGAIDVCRVANFKMTHAKLAVFVEADGYDKIDSVPLVKIHGEEPRNSVMAVRNATGVMDLRARPYWEAWEMFPRVRFDLNVFSKNDVINLLMRVGQQAGIGEGRPNGRTGAGIGFGLFNIVEAEVEEIKIPTLLDAE